MAVCQLVALAVVVIIVGTLGNELEASDAIGNGGVTSSDDAGSNFKEERALDLDTLYGKQQRRDNVRCPRLFSFWKIHG